MISKEEYVRLYCDELLYKTSKVMAVDRDKVAMRMAIDPLKTLDDLDDYGINDIDFGVGLLGEGGVTPLNRRGQQTWGGATQAPKRMSPTDLGMLEKLLNMADEPDWGSEDSIR